MTNCGSVFALSGRSPSVTRTLLNGAIVVITASLVACSSLRERMPGSPSPEKLDTRVRQQIESVVSDADRRALMLERVERVQRITDESAARMIALHERERQLLADYDSPRADFEALFTMIAQERETLRLALLDEHLALKAIATEDEWPRIHAVHARAVEARIAEANSATSSD